MLRGPDVASERKLRGYLGQISLESDHDQHIVGTQREAFRWIDEKGPSKDRHELDGSWEA